MNLVKARILLVTLPLLALASPALALTDTYYDSIGAADLGYVANGQTLEYDHVFAPAQDGSIDISAIDSAWLYVTVLDDAVCSRLRSCVNDWLNQVEVASIDLNQVAWQTGSATAHIFFGEVSAQADLLSNDGVLHVSVTSGGGDFAVLSSLLSTTYEYDYALNTTGGGAGPTPGALPMPEPSAALVFAIGTVTMHGAVRRRRGRDARS